MADPVLYEQDGGVVTLTLNEPATRNAISPAIVEALVEALEDREALQAAQKGLIEDGRVDVRRQERGRRAGTRSAGTRSAGTGRGGGAKGRGCEGRRECGLGQRLERVLALAPMRQSNDGRAEF